MYDVIYFSCDYKNLNVVNKNRKSIWYTLLIHLVLSRSELQVYAGVEANLYKTFASG